jgi:hypothetical protein
VLLMLDLPEEALTASLTSLSIYRGLKMSGAAYAACLSNHGAIRSALGHDDEAGAYLREALAELHKTAGGQSYLLSNRPACSDARCRWTTSSE